MASQAARFIKIKKEGSLRQNVQEEFKDCSILLEFRANKSEQHNPVSLTPCLVCFI